MEEAKVVKEIISEKREMETGLQLAIILHFSNRMFCSCIHITKYMAHEKMALQPVVI
jgi:hypothetical protein